MSFRRHFWKQQGRSRAFLYSRRGSDTSGLSGREFRQKSLFRPGKNKVFFPFLQIYMSNIVVSIPAATSSGVGGRGRRPVESADPGGSGALGVRVRCGGEG